MYLYQEVKGVQEDTVHLLAGQNRLEDECKDPDIFPKVIKANTSEMQAIEEYLKLHYGVVRAVLAYIITKT